MGTGNRAVWNKGGGGGEKEKGSPGLEGNLRNREGETWEPGCGGCGNW